jgi:hypothetical protein
MTPSVGAIFPSFALPIEGIQNAPVVNMVAVIDSAVEQFRSSQIWQSVHTCTHMHLQCSCL